MALSMLQNVSAEPKALQQVRAEKPAWYLAVISGALLRTLDFVAARSAEYLGYLEKGQLPPARLTLTAFEEAFVLEGASAGWPASGNNWCSIYDESMLSFPNTPHALLCQQRLYLPLSRLRSSCHGVWSPWTFAG